MNFSKNLIFYLLLIIFLPFHFLNANPYESTADLPIIANGRIAPLDAATKMWLYDFYHRESLKTDDLKSFNLEDKSALNLFWNMHFSTLEDWKDSPIIFVHYAKVKSILDLNLTQERFSYETLHKALYENPKTALATIKELVVFEFSKIFNDAFDTSQNSSKQRFELKNLGPNIFVQLKGNDLTILSAPKFSPWNLLTAGTIISSDIENSIKNLSKENADELLKLFQTLKSYKDFFQSSESLNSEDNYVTMLKQLERDNVESHKIANFLEEKFPLSKRLLNFKSQEMLPLKNLLGNSTSIDWISLNAFKLKVYNPASKTLEYSDNFTSFKDEDFYSLQESYLALENAVKRKLTIEEIERASKDFSKHYLIAYETLLTNPYKQAKGKALYYPSETMLKVESWLYSFPLIELAIILYSVALFIFAISFFRDKPGKLSFLFLFLGFAMQTLALMIRSYILQRPPVSNMFETVIYVPWIGLIVGFIIYSFNKSKIVLACSAFLSIALLVLLKITQLDMKLENVQAVLDSQYWLIVHVLMIVGSYGAFLVSGLIAHVYLLMNHTKRENEKLSKAILHAMYIGVALLIPGTILGGVWAAESWGRFWDWDPKESWAFITACIYVLIIHAYTFKYIKDLGLSIGAIFGMVAVSFTWYGVNYILGTGLHTYGFGKGGEIYYFAYLGFEALFITFSLLKEKSKGLS